MLELNKIYNQNCVGGLGMLSNSVADICITSPPYKDVDDFSYTLIHDAFWQCQRVLKKNSLCFVNFGHLAGFKSRPFDVVSIIEEIGFTFQETFVWVKNHYKPIQGTKRVNNLTEFIFMFSEGEMPDLNRLSIGIPYKDKSNIGRFAENDLKCAGNVWNIKYETIQKSSQKLHPDRFPIELPLRCLKLANLKLNSLVIDPFCGSATTLLAAKQSGHNYIGFEINENYYNIGIERLK